MRIKPILLVLLSLALLLNAQYPSGLTGAGGAYGKFGAGLMMPGASIADAQQAKVPLSEPVKDSSYMVGPGDEFTISLVGSIVDEVIDVTVDPEGRLLIPKFGIIKVDKFLVSVRQDIIDLIKSKTKNVEVSVQLSRPKAIKIDVSGQLQNAGSHAFEGVVRLSDAVIKANGDRSELPGHLSIRNVKIIRMDKSVLYCDLHDFLLNGNISSNPALYTGDRVVLEQRKYSVNLSGAVSRPWTFEWKDESLFDLINFAGGLNASADSTVRVNRFKKDRSGVETFELKYPDGCKTFRVMAEDNIVCGTDPKWRNGITVTVNGRVKNPGVYSLPKSSTVKDFVNIAGGLLDDADSLGVYLQRPSILNNNGTNVFRQHINDFDVQTAMTVSTGENYALLSTSSLLMDGDILSVPKINMFVSVVGRVARPGLVQFTPSEEWKYYVKLAGGLDGNSYDKYAKVYKRKNNGWVSAGDAGLIEAGDIIMIPELPVEYKWNKFKDMLAITTGLISIATTIIVIGK
ncbi:MAG: SLBB domain-containing protein [Fibrobacteres bacterium]|nr:SLBB domain-containing protein [Fibrobacterota bacterium]